MDPVETAKRIVFTHLPDAPERKRQSLVEEIRWAIVQGQIEARQPLELPPAAAASIVYEILFFIDEYMDRLQGACYTVQLRQLQVARRKILKLHKIAESQQPRLPGRYPPKKSVAKAGD